MKPFTIIIADDHIMMRDGIKHLIEKVEGLTVIAEAGDGHSLLNLLKKDVPDLVIMDISMPGLQGIEATQEIHFLYPETRVLILSMHKKADFISRALTAGACGYLIKEDSGEELIQAIEQIRKGKTYLSKKLMMDFAADIITTIRGEHQGVFSPLTPRERQVLHLIAEGNTDQQISEQLYISVRTAQRHHANIRTKLNAKHTAELVRYAISQGYISER